MHSDILGVSAFHAAMGVLPSSGFYSNWFSIYKLHGMATNAWDSIHEMHSSGREVDGKKIRGDGKCIRKTAWEKVLRRILFGKGNAKGQILKTKISTVTTLIPDR